MSTSKRVRVVNIPAQFLPLIEEEIEKGGYYSQTQLMGEILAEHFKGKNPKAGKEKTLVKGVIHSETES